MKKSLLLPLLVAFLPTLHLLAQPKFDWAHLLFDDTQEAELSWFNVGPQGDMLFVGGYAGSTLDLGGGTALSQPNGSDGAVFVAVFDKTGQPKWVRQIFSKQNTSLYDDGYFLIADAPDGSVYVYGDFVAPKVFFGTDFTLNKLCTDTDCSEVFLAKYSANGDFQWARAIAANSYGTGIAQIAAGPSGEVVVTGGTYGSMTDFGNGQTVSSVLGEASYLAKFNASGDCQWARAFEGDGFSNYFYYLEDALHVSSAGDIFFAANIEGTIDFGNGVQVSAPNPDSDNLALLKFNSAGTAKWGQVFSTPGYGSISFLNTDGAGNIYAFGYASDGLDFNGQPVLPADPDAYYDFLLKTDPQATAVEWVKSINENEVDAYFDWMEVTPAGKILVSGEIYEDIDFEGATLAAGDCGNSFLAQFSANGSLDWSRTVGSTESCDGGMAVWSDAQNNLYVLGLFDATSTAADSFVINSDPNASEGWFIGRLPAGSVPAHEPGAAAAALSCSPNPTGTGVFAVNLTEPSLLTVSAADGRSIFQQDFQTAGPQHVALPADVPSGVYLVRAQGKSGIASGRLILSH